MARGLARRTTAVLVLTLAAALSGCSEERPANDSLPTSSAEPSASASELPPLGPPEFPVPDEAREKTPEGALEFTRYYVSLIEYIANGDLNPTPLRELSQACALCNQMADSFLNDRNAGNLYSEVSIRFDPYGWTVIHEDRVEVGFVCAQSAVTVSDPSGRVLPDRSTQATGDLQSGATLEWLDDARSWTVASLTIG